MNTRRISSVVRVGSVLIGGDNPIRLQSMTTVDTNDTAGCVSQIKRMVDAGAELVRLTTQGQREAKNLFNIRKALEKEGYDVPLVADVHFNPNVATTAAECCSKVRINPGNYVDPARTFQQHAYSDAEYAEELRKIDAKFTPLLRVCKAHGTALRLGVNHGSLSDRIRNRYGDTPKGIVESCLEYLRICQREGFTDVILSIKASNTVVMVRSCRLLVEEMSRENMYFPLHLGVTEAGDGEEGRIKSAVGIGALLTEGIGDTIRVSLSEEPEAELPVAKKIVSFVEECAALRNNATISDDKILLSFNENDSENLQIKASMAAGALLIDGKAHGLIITNHGRRDTLLEDKILQAARIKFTKTEFISCPSCGRTHYNLQATVAKIKSALAQAAQTNPKINTLKIAIMGCIVNGPGEMADADYGYVGTKVGYVALYKGKQCVESSVPEDEAVEHLLQLIGKEE